MHTIRYKGEATAITRSPSTFPETRDVKHVSVCNQHKSHPAPPPLRNPPLKMDFKTFSWPILKAEGRPEYYLLISFATASESIQRRRNSR